MEKQTSFRGCVNFRRNFKRRGDQKSQHFADIISGSSQIRSNCTPLRLASHGTTELHSGRLSTEKCSVGFNEREKLSQYLARCVEEGAFLHMLGPYTWVTQGYNFFSLSHNTCAYTFIYLCQVEPPIRCDEQKQKVNPKGRKEKGSIFDTPNYEFTNCRREQRFSPSERRKRLSRATGALHALFEGNILSGTVSF